MSKEYIFKKLFILFCLGILFFSSQESSAQFRRISIRGDFGAGYLPLSAWKNFWEDISSDYFSKERFGRYWDIELGYYVAEKHIVVFSVENIKTSASLYGIMVFTAADDTIGFSSSIVDWDFKTTPIGFSYEFHPKVLPKGISPFFGIGFSYYISELKADFFEIYNTLFEKWKQTSKRTGQGYGFHTHVGLQSRITEHLFVVSRVRARYADGMGFTDKKDYVKVEFTGVDFTLGLGWKF